jgi:tripartite-type tricarboxylate transporter receptor subunit TctC
VAGRVIFVLAFLWQSLNATAFAEAQTYPSRPIRILVGFAPGGIVDEVARYLGEYITRETGQVTVVENAPGAAGTTSLRTVARAEPDGYTIGVAISGNLVISPFVQKNMPVDALNDLKPVASLVEAPVFIATGPSVPGERMADLIRFSQSRSEGVAYGSPGAGSLPHLSAALFSKLTGITAIHVPYRGATPAILDTMAGKIDFVSSAYGDLRPGLDNHTLKARLVASSKRVSFAPNVPAAPEVGLPNYEVSTWLGVVAPKGLPDPVLSRLHDLVGRMLEDPQMRKRLSDRDMDPMAMTQSDFASFLGAQYAAWGKRIQELGIEPQ